jgi:fructose-1,6-bisphosphatase/inositol monophosphatase family enzyme
VSVQALHVQLVGCHTKKCCAVLMQEIDMLFVDSNSVALDVQAAAVIARNASSPLWCRVPAADLPSSGMRQVMRHMAAAQY